MRDLCESDWFDKRPPVAWWEYDVVVGDGRDIASAYEAVLVQAGWTRLEGQDGHSRFQSEQAGWTADAIVSSSDNRVNVSVYVLNSDDC